MTCDDVRHQLTGYLDGDLDAARGSAVRGHLRGCDACREVAADEAALRDGLRGLPPVDPPPSLWAGVQQRLAAAEVADAERPAWRRALARVTQWMPRLPQLAAGGVALAAAVALLVVHHHGHDEVAQPGVAMNPTAPPRHEVPTPPAAAPVASSATDESDVTADLAGEAARVTGEYAKTAGDLEKLAGEARTRWTDDRKQTFDGKVAELHKKIGTAAEGYPREAAYRDLIHYLRNAAVRDEVAVNDRVFAGACP